MCKINSYSKYQKSAIKFLNDLLGTGIPFSYEKAQNNHLKVLIDGIAKPIYTGSTPSDRKSIANFKAEVKRELKASQENNQATAQLPKLPLKIIHAPSYEKLTQTAVKMLRSRLPILKSQEEERVLEAKNVDAITEFRLENVKSVIVYAKQSSKPLDYIKPKEMKQIEITIIKHLNFMLPSKAFYSELIDNKNKYFEVQQEGTSNQSVIVDVSSPSCRLHHAKVTDINEPKQEFVKNDHIGLANGINDPITELMTFQSQKRISELRRLSKAQALMLIDEINQAISINREKDIQEVIALIKTKDISLEALISRFEKES